MANTQTATPTKLQNGTWGARVQGDVAQGDTVTISTRSGKSWTATVDRVVWSGNGVSIVATSKGASRSAHSRGTWTGCNCGSVTEYSKNSDCRTCQIDA